MLIFSNIQAKFSGLFHECYWTTLQLHLILAPSSWKKICSWSTQLNFNVLMMSHPKVKQQLRLLRKTSRTVHSWWTCEFWPVTQSSLTNLSHIPPFISQTVKLSITVLLQMWDMFLGWTLPTLGSQHCPVLLQLVAFPQSSGEWAGSMYHAGCDWAGSAGLHRCHTVWPRSRIV